MVVVWSRNKTMEKCDRTMWMASRMTTNRASGRQDMVRLESLGGMVHGWTWGFLGVMSDAGSVSRIR